MEGSHRKRNSKPKLERRNAMKNIDYQVSSSSSSSTRSLDDVALLRTSFRVVEGVDGEFDLLFRSLGLSGPEDFEIPTADWEAQKAKKLLGHEISGEFHSGVGINGDTELKGENLRAGVGVGGHTEFKSESFQSREERKIDVSSSSSNSRASGSNGGGGGIKGVRPPVLSPPPAMLRPIVDHDVSSTWDIVRSFAPQDEDEDENEEVVREESNLVSDSGSSVSHDDDDDENDDKNAGVVEDSVYNVSPSGSLRRTFSSWQKGDILGKGSFGTVYEGFTSDGFFFAVKEVSLLDQGSQGKQSIFQLQQEISLLSQFEHENIVRYFGTDKDNSTLYIFLELMTKGSLANLYQKYRLRDPQVSAYTRQILSGLKYLHDQNVVHRDIKCGNILVDASGSVKLADFGLAKATKLNDVKSSKGSPYWMAPEVVNLRSRGYGLKADIWSLGCTVLEMLTRQPPYSQLEGMQALFRIGRGEPPPIPESISKDARDFIHKCLQVNPNKRPTAAQLLEHPFVKRPPQTPLSPASPLVINNFQS
ncbi:mitogen-activated protein kinase kinase kinase 1-like [Senna tora]|uniref:mitogen-activated protein kinase kinase kinase n=1 Tax=Senna tora TaxID=362788 RepID=A0A834SMJ5_9FABA|nr:mitogen-activated protein kinase kinase kinase 1-like [Senna tora]